MMMMTMMTVPARTIKRNNNVVKTKTKKEMKTTKKNTNKTNKFKLIINKSYKQKTKTREKPHKKIAKVYNSYV